MMAEPSLTKTFIAGGVGGACVVFVGHPLDTIKVMLQTQPRPVPGTPVLYASAWDCFVKIFRHEGVPGLYKGMLSPLLGVTPINAIVFLGYGFGKKIQQTNPNDVLTMKQIGLAGALSGFLATAVTVPVERVKCVMQVQRSTGGVKRYSNSLVCGVQLYRSGGVSALYRGLVITWIRDIPGLGLYFASYEAFIRWITQDGRSRKDLNPLYVMCAGSIAGVLDWGYSIVPDTLKSRIQTVQDKQNKGIADVYRTLVRTEGYRALFKGTGPIMLRAIPANAACFLGYETAIKFLDRVFPNL
ncbi:hypothetical protein EMCRGX_G013393 [Ephydatia muelleri]|eukprot:Em0004g1055a